MKVKTSKGFTLAELLIVMAIIVVLAAVAIPTFSRQLETARETGDMELIRNAYTDALALAIIDASDGTLDGNKGSASVIPSTDSSNFSVTGSTDGTRVYCAKLASATTQSKTTFDYVNSTVAGQAATATNLYDEYVNFTFQLDANGNVNLQTVATTDELTA